MSLGVSIYPKPIHFMAKKQLFDILKNSAIKEYCRTQFLLRSGWMVSVDLFEEEDNNVEREKSPLEMMAEKRSQIIFKQRMSVGLTQSELAERANVTQKTVSRMERGDSKVRETTLQKVYEVLGITEKHLETLREQPNT